MIEVLKACVTRREARKQDRRQAIIEAARISFLEHGYAGTSMSGLLKTLGGSKATLWGYFRSKEELFAAVVEDVSANFRAELYDVLKPTDALEPTLAAFCHAFMRKITAPESLAAWRLVVAESGRFPEVGQIFYDRAARHTREALSRFFARHVADGHLRDENPDRMAETVIDLCAGLQTRRLWGVSDPALGLGARAVEISRLFMRAYSIEARSAASVR
jgi:TetR/AcrR family transcriptional repressor of mexJK operon